MDVKIKHLRPTFQRLKNLRKFSKDNSPLRALQYEKLAEITLNRKVLDFGGGERSRYREMLRECDYFSVNINSEMLPSKIIQVGEKIPFEDQTFDTVLALNTLEHIFDAESVIGDLLKVLKRSGELYITTPFLFRIHGAPDDYFRPTPSWYINVFKKFNVSKISIDYLRWGPLTTGLTCACLPPRMQHILMPFAYLFDLLSWKQSSQSLISNPIGFWIKVIK